MDPSLYSGSAAYYTRGRFAYPEALADVLARELGLDGSGRLLDVGCGPGSLTLLLARYFSQAVGIDADADMLAEASRAGAANCRWLHLRAEQLPADLGEFRLITFAQSFHWLDRPHAAATARTMLEPGGACVHVHATTHQGVDGTPYAAITDLVRTYLGPVRRAGQGTLPGGTPGGEAEIYRAAGFTGPQQIRVPGRLVTRAPDDIVASVFSLSSSAPHLFGDRLGDFESDLRKLVGDNVFTERTHDIGVDIWLP
ncbi:class I SAM-dependent methyltransferase [Amycolatopsis sp. cg5]|uniref:class I SAM-dependent methyltransferase n=1 Tax=Amycolatopsis sp. cg5 TaxID=3238802 RepID=UPI003523AEA6